MFSRKRIYYNHNGNHIVLTSYVRDNPHLLYRIVVDDELCVISIPMYSCGNLGNRQFAHKLDTLRALVLNPCVCWGL